MDKVTSSTPHDAVFKQLLSHPETARDFLDIHLPPTVRPVCDLQTLKLEPASFVKPDLRAYHSDMIWSVQTTRGTGYLYVVVEHQSTPDKLMAFRLIRYAMDVMQRHLDKGNKTLPLVVPMLFYHGRIRPYPHSLCWLDAFTDPVLARQLYSETFPLIDITAIPDEEIMRHRRVALLEFLQKHVYQRDLIQYLEQIVSLLSLEYTTDSQQEPLLNYMLCCGDSTDFYAFIHQIAERLPQHREELMTIADRLRADAHQKGMQEGKQEEALRIARTLLAKGLERDVVLSITGLSEKDL